MALPEHAYEFSSPLTVEDLSPEAMTIFGEYCRQSERTMLRDVFRENIKIEMPFQTSAGDEAAIFAAIFDEDV